MAQSRRCSLRVRLLLPVALALVYHSRPCHAGLSTLNILPHEKLHKGRGEVGIGKGFMCYCRPEAAFRRILGELVVPIYWVLYGGVLLWRDLAKGRIGMTTLERMFTYFGLALLLRKAMVLEARM